MRIPFVAAVLLAPLASPASPAGSSAVAWRGDARFLAAAFDSLHPAPYRHHTRLEWAAAAESLERRLPSLAPADAVAGLARLAALAGDGHSRLDQVRLSSHRDVLLAPLAVPGFGVSFPVVCGLFADGLFVVRTRAAQTDLLGRRVVAI